MNDDPNRLLYDPTFGSVLAPEFVHRDAARVAHEIRRMLTVALRRAYNAYALARTTKFILAILCVVVVTLLVGVSPVFVGVVGGGLQLIVFGGGLTLPKLLNSFTTIRVDVDAVPAEHAPPMHPDRDRTLYWPTRVEIVVSGEVKRRWLRVGAELVRVSW